MLVQIIGKTRLAVSPVQNHWWNVPLYVTARGLSTSSMAIDRGALLDIEFDFVSHVLTCRRSTGETLTLPLRAQSVADFYKAYKNALERLEVEHRIWTMPVECQVAIPFEEDTTHRSYDANAAHRFWQVLCRADTVFKQFATRFSGKTSPVHFFWGSFDLALTRFNGRLAPPRQGSDKVQREAYSHECISAGFWPGNGGYGRAAFYSYAVPAPAGLESVVLRSGGRFDKGLGEFILPYDEVRESTNPEETVLEFLQSTYASAADLAGWDREQLERAGLPAPQLGLQASSDQRLES